MDETQLIDLRGLPRDIQSRFRTPIPEVSALAIAFGRFVEVPADEVSRALTEMIQRVRGDNTYRLPSDSRLSSVREVGAFIYREAVDLGTEDDFREITAAYLLLNLLDCFGHDNDPVTPLSEYVTRKRGRRVLDAMTQRFATGDTDDLDADGELLAQAARLGAQLEGLLVTEFCLLPTTLVQARVSFRKPIEGDPILDEDELQGMITLLQAGALADRRVLRSDEEFLAMCVQAKETVARRRDEEANLAIQARSFLGSLGLSPDCPITVHLAGSSDRLGTATGCHLFVGAAESPETPFAVFVYGPADDSRRTAAIVQAIKSLASTPSILSASCR
jgi:hypothetical protein